MVLLAQVQPTSTVLRCTPLDAGKNALIRNLLAPVPGLALSFLEEKWVAGGLRKQARLCGCSPKPRPVPNLPRTRMELAWRNRWAALLACAAGRALASSLLGLRGGGCGDGDIPQPFDVERDWRHVC